MWKLTKNFLASEDQNVLVKVDPQWGFAEFPAFGDSKKHTLPVLLDPEATQNNSNLLTDGNTKTSDTKRLKEFWMPDKYCKVCYGCEEAFTMYRRRHHCRLCGQVFCNNCSSYFIEGSLLNMQGSVRACRSCYEQAAEQAEKESRSLKKKLSDKSVVEFKFKQMQIQQQQQQQQLVDADPAIEISRTMLNLQNRASNHLVGIVERLVDHSEIAAQKNDWKDIIVNLVKEVVSSVDPDVRAGDSLDIRPYVKIKIIPGGLRSESVYIDGVVFRKNVAHKKMAAGGWKENPRILLIASGIEFQRTDMKLSSMDTLIEQEDKFMEILVQKLMSLKPDIILVGRSVARKAQELLCEHNVIVMQNVKVELLERVAGMTGAMVLPSTDNVVKQFGEECLGTCGQFWMRLVQDDPEKDSSLQPRRVLRTRISRGSTYAYIQGCPPERGCTIVLRGGDRTVLSQVKQILSFAIVVAYHLRLEVAYYLDRNADLPSTPDAVFYDDSSDIDDEIVDENITANKLKEAGSLLSEYVETVPLAKKRQERQLLSTSLDIDYNLPFGRELIGTQLFKTKHLAKFHVENQQTLLITSLLMGEGSTGIPAQKSPADVKGIKYYTKHDIALGQFIIENCFQLSRGGHKEPRMLDQTLSFVHRPGRIDITVRKAGNAPSDENAYLNRDPHNAPLYLSSYCKDCGRVVTPSRLLSDETWKMSFGKFLEITFYNRSARCQAPGCNHSLRDSHILSLACENYVAIFEFVPIHAYALHIRDGMSFPEDIHRQQTLQLLAQLPSKHIVLMEEFRIAMFELEKEIKDVLVGRHEDLCLAMADVRMMESELNTLSITFLEDLLKTYECIPRAYADVDNETKVRNILTEKLTKTVRPSDVSSENNSESGWSPTPLTQEETMALAESESLSKKERESAFIRPTDLDAQSEIGDRDIFQDLAVTEVNPIVALHFPATLMRNTFLRAMRWNTRIETIYRFLDSVRNMLLQQQQQQQQQHSSQLSIIAPNPAIVTAIGTNELLDTNLEADADYHSNKKQLVEAVTQDLSRTEEGGLASSPPRVLDSFSAPHSTKDSLHSPISLQPVSTTDSMPSIIAQAQAIIQASESNPTSAQPLGLSSLYRAVLEQSRRTAEKPGDKMSRITKVLSRFLAGNKDNNADDQRKFIVPLGDFNNGRFGLKPGRNGEVIAVSEDVLASVIAYALASQEYYDDLQTSIHENIDQMDADIMPQDMEPSANASERQNISEMSTPTASEKTVVTSAAETALNTLSLPFQKKKKVVKIDITNNNLEPIPEEHLEEHDLDNEDADPTSLPSSQVLSKNPSTYGLNTFMEGFSSNNEDNTNMSNHADAAFGGSSGLFPNDFSKATDGITEVEEVDLRSPTSTASRTPRSGTVTSPLPEWERSSDKSSVNNTTVGTGDLFSSADGANQRSEGSEPKFESALDNPIERQLTSQDKSNIRVRFDDYDDQGNLICKFQCQVYRAKQFEALRACYFHDEDCRENFIRSLAMTNRWVAQGGKSGAAFAKTSDERLVIKVVSRVELQMFLDFAPAYFEYMARAYFHNLPSLLCKILGVYTVRFDNKETGKKGTENVVVMENIFYERSVSRTFDLKGSSRARYVELVGQKADSVDELLVKRRRARRILKMRSSTVGSDDLSFSDAGRGSGLPDGMDRQSDLSAMIDSVKRIPQVLLDDNLMEFTKGRPFPLKHRAKIFFHKAVQNDTLFLSIVNVVDYSILVGFDDKNHELTVGIIDFLRQYDIIKKMERVGKGSVGMLTGQAEPTIIQPSQYRKRFTTAMERYFMTVPDKWIAYEA